MFEENWKKKLHGCNSWKPKNLKGWWGQPGHDTPWLRRKICSIKVNGWPLLEVHTDTRKKKDAYLIKFMYIFRKIMTKASFSPFLLDILKLLVGIESMFPGWFWSFSLPILENRKFQAAIKNKQTKQTKPGLTLPAGTVAPTNLSEQESLKR